MSVAVILAAGLSSRMGRFKPLLPFGGKTMIEHTAARLREGGAGEITVVTGFLALELEQALRGADVAFVHNPDYAASQMLDSVKLGISKAPPGDLLIVPGDLPQFDPALLPELLRADGDAAYPVCSGRNGHPLLLRSYARNLVLRYSGARGLRGALDALHTVGVPTQDEGCVLDADTYTDYGLLLELRRRSAPTPGEQRELFCRHQTPEQVLRHCETVRRVALRLAMNIPDIDLRLLDAAARIHDAARTCPHHAQVLAEELSRMGYGRMADIVRVHMELPEEESEALTERSLLYLADKLVLGDQVVSLQERFGRAERKFAGDKEALAAVYRKRETAQRILTQIKRTEHAEIPAVQAVRTGGESAWIRLEG